MKMLKTYRFVFERAKVKPITNAEWNIAKKDLKKNMNPFKLSEKDLIKNIKGFPMGVVVRIMEEGKNQRDTTDAIILDLAQNVICGVFDWSISAAGREFWNKVINDKDFDLFFERYPGYMKYN